MNDRACKLTPIEPPDLYATLQDGKVIGLYAPLIVWKAANQPLILMGQREITMIDRCYPDVYELTFSLPYGDKRLETDDARLDVNGVRFIIDSCSTEGSSIRYTATGYPISVARTIPQDDNLEFPDWEDVGYGLTEDDNQYDDYDY